ncbi:putative membrane protein [Streptomyces sp. LBL]|uniref:sensor domain-containing protein n=1 Tax=Streptomyces sp. LBL TaxID=2940562 RepID=UPI002476A47E|nr:sensor domain-containing protein [Streptomyces sp. LBL]MDH6628304.1 putative membrane protein [Streptomyces sp. LBL]
MAIHQDAAAGERSTGLKDNVVRALSATGIAIAQLASGLNTAFLAVLVLLWLAVTAVTSLVGVGLLMVPVVLRALHSLAGQERERLGRWGSEVVAPEPPPTQLRAALVGDRGHPRRGTICIALTS